MNWNLGYQFFCGVVIAPLNPLTNFKLLSEIRVKLSKKLKIESVQSALSVHWMPYLQEKDQVVADAVVIQVIFVIQRM